MRNKTVTGRRPEGGTWRRIPGRHDRVYGLPGVDRVGPAQNFVVKDLHARLLIACARGIAATEKAAIDLAKKHSPHLVLADVQLRGSDSGITAVKEIMQAMTVPVIFVTGYPERLLTGTQLEPAFVISKPFDPDLLRAAIAQALDTVSI